MSIKPELFVSEVNFEGLVSFLACHIISEGSLTNPVSFLFSSNSLVTAVPIPLISGLEREEVSSALVLHFLWKPQEDSEVDVSHSGSISRPWMDHRRKKT